MTTATTCTVTLPGAGPVDVAVSDYGDGQPFLLLHGGGGPDTVTGFGELFAKTHDVRVIVPTHPGFGGTARPAAHLPQLETPQQLMTAIWDSASNGFSGQRNRGLS